jgi:adenylate kinase family enzyme
MRRIAVIGSPGSGKSTVSGQLGNITGIEVVHLDKIFWKPGWVQTPRTEWVLLQQRLVAKDSWIIDGHYGSTINIRLQAADTIIWLDMPTSICLFRAIVRMIRYRGQVRSDMGSGCPERIDLEFVRFIWRFSRQERPRIACLLDAAHDRGKNIVRLKTAMQVNQYLASLAR